MLYALVFLAAAWLALEQNKKNRPAFWAGWLFIAVGLALLLALASDPRWLSLKRVWLALGSLLLIWLGFIQTAALFGKQQKAWRSFLTSLHASFKWQVLALFPIAFLAILFTYLG